MAGGRGEVAVEGLFAVEFAAAPAHRDDRDARELGGGGDPGVAGYRNSMSYIR